MTRRNVDDGHGQPAPHDGSLVIALATTAALPGFHRYVRHAGRCGRGDVSKPTGGDTGAALYAGSQSSTAQWSEMAKHTIRRATLTVSDKAIAAGAILSAEAHPFNLFPDAQIVAVRNRVESRSTRSYPGSAAYRGTSSDGRS